jgi:hypothetical protein
MLGSSCHLRFSRIASSGSAGSLTGVVPNLDDSESLITGLGFLAVSLAGAVPAHGASGPAAGGDGASGAAGRRAAGGVLPSWAGGATRERSLGCGAAGADAL